MDKRPTKPKRTAEAEEAPDELDADAKASAFDAEANELDKRLRMLCHDYSMLFLCYPNVEGRPSTEALEKMQLLSAIRVHPWRKQLAAQAVSLQAKAFGEGHNWFLQMWIDAIPAIVQRREWDAQAVASKIRNEVKESKRCKDPDPKTIGRLALEAMGYEGARHLRLLRPSNN